jgi:hypothetical protein
VLLLLLLLLLLQQREWAHTECGRRLLVLALDLLLLVARFVRWLQPLQLFVCALSAQEVWCCSGAISGAHCEWHYVYNGGEECSHFETYSNSNASDSHGRRVLAGASVSSDSNHGAPLRYGSLGHSKEQLEQTLLRFNAWPVIVAVCFGWSLMGIMLAGRMILTVRRRTLIRNISKRFKEENGGLTYPEFAEIDIEELGNGRKFKVCMCFPRSLSCMHKRVRARGPTSGWTRVVVL